MIRGGAMIVRDISH